MQLGGSFLKESSKANTSPHAQSRLRAEVPKDPGEKIENVEVKSCSCLCDLASCSTSPDFSAVVLKTSVNVNHFTRSGKQKCVEWRWT